MLGVVGAMAALSIDVVTLYTARSEAQLAADGAALAAARVIANSGATSDSTGALLMTVTAIPGPASVVATQVAVQNQVGGVNLTSANVNVTFGGSSPFNPTVTVRVQVTNLPAFFARIWGGGLLSVAATATAEAYNPSGGIIAGAASSGPPVAPICVKPWLIPNMDPSAGGAAIFNAATGAVSTATLLGWVSPAGAGNTKLRDNCMGGGGTCTAANAPTTWRYYPGTTDAAGDFPAPATSSCVGCAGYNNFQLSIAGCVQPPIACNQKVNVDTTTADTTRDIEAAAAVDNLTHATGVGGDSVDTSAALPPGGTAPFQFLAGNKNMAVLAGALSDGTDIMVSDSLVTVPVIDTTTWPPPAFPQVQIIGFVQLFLNPTGAPVPATNHIHTQVINIVGCGLGAAPPQPILGNGASPVAVRLISQ